MTSDEIRAAFLRFFETRGHRVIASSSLIPHGDPTLLLTTAGMVQFKPYYLGVEMPPNPKLASCQKCFRTTDIDSVGDSTHLTFFEMLGNFSIGDYFKEEAIGWAWEFVTRHLGLPPERLWITIYLDDDQAFDIWRKLGVAEQRILRFGEEDNFWGPAGDSGPCGPCSEIHYDFGEGVGCGRADCDPSCGCGRFSEMWNLVFTQYNQDETGKRTPLPRPNIDTGMGLERTAAIMQGKSSVYETDLFLPLMEDLSRLSGKEYGADDKVDHALRVVAEHARGITFLIGDGVMPANEGRGYVLRRLLRRAVLFGKRLGINQPFLAEAAGITIGQMEAIYPELGTRRDFILKTVAGEETRFQETLNTGLELLDGIMNVLAGNKESVVAGAEVFRLYDTYGFPVELTREMAAERGFSLDLAGFKAEMEKQRQRAKASQRFGANAADLNAGDQLAVSRTPFVGYQATQASSATVNILVGGRAVNDVSVGQEANVILEATPFYGEMGGQLGDTGEIVAATGRFAVDNTIHLTPDIVVHQGKVTEGELRVGDSVEAVVDRERRQDIARNHTATHLLQFALRQVLGKHVQQGGSLVAPEHFRFDFSHPVGLMPEQVAEVHSLVNEKIRQNLPVYAEELPYKQAVAEGAIALFDEKYGDTVRVLKIGRPPVSTELCGGTHVSATGDIGFFYIVSEASIGSGLRRITAVTGRGGLDFIEARFAAVQRLARVVDATVENVEAKVNNLVGELERERRQARSFESELARIRAEALVASVEVIKGINVVAARVPTTRIEALREMCDLLRERLESAIIVLGTVYNSKPAFVAAVTPDLVAKGYKAGDIIKQVAGVTGGGGGGRAMLAQAGGRDKNKLDEALSLVQNLI